MSSSPIKYTIYYLWLKRFCIPTIFFSCIYNIKMPKYSKHFSLANFGIAICTIFCFKCFKAKISHHFQCFIQALTLIISMY